MKLNRLLVAKQDLTNKEIALIHKLHKKKNKLFLMVKYWMKKGEIAKIIQSGKKIQEIEFEMQDAWQFKRDASRHSHWVFNPACTCPKMDNLEPLNIFAIHSSRCIVHGPDLLKIENIKSVVRSNCNSKILEIVEK